MANNNSAVRLPSVIVGAGDLTRVYRELKTLDDQLSQLEIASGSGSVAMPKISPVLIELAQTNSYDISLRSDRAKMLIFLERLKDGAPRFHMSFAGEPSDEAVHRIVKWLRDEISAYTLLQVGIQPAIVAGCILRTPNRVFDLSLRHKLNEAQPVLTEKIRAL